jgi:SAM-dependent methyltransferase
VFSTLAIWWREQSDIALGARLHRLGSIIREFLRDSLPDRRRQRFGDADFDWDYHVDTTSANISWRSRLIGLFNSSYQPIEADIFRDILSSLVIDFSQFTFVDVGSGKGRALLLASEFPFRRIVGIEFLPELNRIAQENIRKSSAAQGRTIPAESVCSDATTFVFPDEPILLYMFHPLPESGFRKVVSNLQASLQRCPRTALIVYANPIFEMVLAAERNFKKITGTHQYAVYEAV